MINKTYIENFIIKKHKTESLTLKHNSIYVLPSSQGCYLLLITILNFILGVNYQNNLILIVSYLMFTLFVVCFIIGYMNFNRIKVSVESTHSDFKDTPPTLQLKFIPNNIHYSLNISSEKFNINHEIRELSQQLNLTLNLNSNRGYFSIGKLKISSQYPFGLVNVWSYIVSNKTLYIYPERKFDDSTLIQLTNANSEDSYENKSISNDEFAYFKNYQKGMSLNKIAWKQYAKTGQLYIKNFEDEENQAELAFNYSNVKGDKESRVSKLSYLIDRASKNNIKFSLIMPNQIIRPDNTQLHTKKCLEAISEY